MQLQSHPQSQLNRPLEQQARILFGHHAIREDQLGHAREGAVNAALVARIPLSFLAVEPAFPEGAVVADVAQVAVEKLADMVEDEADMRGQHLRLELRNLPPRQIGGPAVVESRVIADAGRQRLEEMIGLHAGARVEVDVAVEDKPRLAGNGDRAAVDVQHPP